MLDQRIQSPTRAGKMSFVSISQTISICQVNHTSICPFYSHGLYIFGRQVEIAKVDQLSNELQRIAKV